jgi:hypothetical protein
MDQRSGGWYFVASIVSPSAAAIARFGEYRTARLVLQAWDRLERGELAG